MRQWTLSLAVVALIAGTSFAGKYNTKLSIDDKAPAIAALPAVDGDKEVTINLADVKEDVVVVAFLANHCPAVKANEDRLVDVAKGFKGKSVKFIGVCCSSEAAHSAEEDGIPGIKSAIKQGKYNITYGYDPSGAIGKAYGAKVTPEFFVLDKNRSVKYMGALDDSVMAEGKATKTYLKTAIENVLANETVEATEIKATGCGIPYKR
jgi:peroxiredoxin